MLVPSGAGVGSAIGFLRAPVSFEVVRSELRLLSLADPASVEQRLREMEAEARAIVGPASGDAVLSVTRLAELRYAGQGHELRVRLPAASDGPLTRATLEALAQQFEQAYEQVYGLRVPGSDVEAVTWSVTVATPAAVVAAATLPPATATRRAEASRAAWEPAAGDSRPFGQHWRFDVAAGEQLQGPALVIEHETTTVVPAGWRAALDSHGHLRMEDAE